MNQLSVYFHKLAEVLNGSCSIFSQSLFLQVREVILKGDLVLVKILLRNLVLSNHLCCYFRHLFLLFNLLFFSSRLVFQKLVIRQI